jgi:hypothetical protein
VDPACLAAAGSSGGLGPFRTPTRRRCPERSSDQCAAPCRRPEGCLVVVAGCQAVPKIASIFSAASSFWSGKAWA